MPTQLDAAAPEVWVEISQPDAQKYDIFEGDVLAVSSPRSTLRTRARITGIRPGVLFVPFHYGYWDTGPDSDPQRPHDRAANELTLTDWDPASKQPLFKTAAARVHLVARGDGPAPAPTTTASAPTRPGVPATVGGAAAGETVTNREPE